MVDIIYLAAGSLFLIAACLFVAKAILEWPISRLQSVLSVFGSVLCALAGRALLGE